MFIYIWLMLDFLLLAGCFFFMSMPKWFDKGSLFIVIVYVCISLFKLVELHDFKQTAAWKYTRLNTIRLLDVVCRFNLYHFFVKAKSFSKIDDVEFTWNQ